MRTLLVTGPGGAGTSTVAAATALAAVRDQRARTLLISDDPPPGLAAGAVPGLTVRPVDSAAAFRERAVELRDRFGMVFDLLGANPLDEEEFTELPGAEAFALLRALGAAGDHDLVVVDLPPLPHSLAVLALPEQLRRYLARLLPAERQAARALRPVLAQLAGVPMPAEWLYDTAARWDAELAAVQAVVAAATTSVRLVAEPGARSAARLRTARTGLALYGLRLESVTANRLPPAGSADPFLAALAEGADAFLAGLPDTLGDPAGRITVHRVPHLGREPHGPEDLLGLGVPAPPPAGPPEPPASAAVAEAPAGSGAGYPAGGRTAVWDGPGEAAWDAPPDARARPGSGEAPREAALAPDPWRVEDRLEAEGHLLWRLPLPGATRDGLDLVRRGDELVVDAAGFRRIVPLASALRRCRVEGAALRDGALLVRFTPDPELWPR